MKKNVIFGVGGVVVGGGIGFMVGRMTYKKKLDKAERDIEVLLKEINRPEEESEVSDDEETEEEEASEGDAGVTESEADSSSPSDNLGPGKIGGWTISRGSNGKYSYSDGNESIDYEKFYRYKSNYILDDSEDDSGVVGSGVRDGGGNEVDPAELEHPSEDSDLEDNETPESFWETEEEREYKLKEELKSAGLYIDETNEDYHAGLEMSREMNSGKKPRLITADSYFDDYPHHNKVVLEYYTDSDILVDTETEEELPDENLIVGDCLDKYGFRDNDEEFIIYVRNFNFGIDYQISKVFGSWDPV